MLFDKVDIHPSPALPLCGDAIIDWYKYQVPNSSSFQFSKSSLSMNKLLVIVLIIGSSTSAPRFGFGSLTRLLNLADTATEVATSVLPDGSRQLEGSGKVSPSAGIVKTK